jgi:pilus assembly protein Flp/PilA
MKIEGYRIIQPDYRAQYHKEDTVLQFAEALYGLYAEEQEGQGLVEYALIIAFIAILVIIALIFLRGQISTLFSRVGNSLQ